MRSGNPLGKRIYLDYAATAPLKPQAQAAMAGAIDRFGNPSSLHNDGRAAKAEIDLARERVSTLFGCSFGEVVFTSGGTEAANLALIGLALNELDAAGGMPRRNKVLLGAGEHHCVLNTRPLLERLGFRVAEIPIDRSGRVRLDALESMLGPEVLAVSVMHTNNEFGTLQPVAEVAALAHVAGAFYHCDAVQAFGVPNQDGTQWTVDTLTADLVSVSAHKMGGPKGVGALYVRAGTKLKPLIAGGEQEREARGGTENVLGIIGFGAVAEPGEITNRRAARDAFEALVSGAEPTVPPAIPRHAGISHQRFPGLDAETLLIRLDREGVSASSGSACASGSIEPSHVLIAAGFSGQEAKEGLRFSFGEQTSIEEAERAAEILNSVVHEVRASRAART